MSDVEISWSCHQRCAFERRGATVCSFWAIGIGTKELRDIKSPLALVLRGEGGMSQYPWEERRRRFHAGTAKRLST